MRDSIGDELYNSPKFINYMQELWHQAKGPIAGASISSLVLVNLENEEIHCPLLCSVKLVDEDDGPEGTAVFDFAFFSNRRGGIDISDGEI